MEQMVGLVSYPYINVTDLSRVFPSPRWEGSGEGKQQTVMKDPTHPPPAPPSGEGSLTSMTLIRTSEIAGKYDRNFFYSFFLIIHWFYNIFSEQFFP